MPGGTVASGGSKPVSIAVHGDLVYVANAGATGSNYTGFRLGWDGRLHTIPDSTVALPDGSQPGDVLFNVTGTKLAGTRVNTSLIDSFTVDPSGRLHAAPGSPYAAQGVGPFGSEFRPSDPSELYVSNAHGGPGNGTVSAFQVGWNGALQSIGASPFAINRDGTLTSLSVRQFVGNPTGLAPVDARLSPDGRTLFVVDQGADEVSAFAARRRPPARYMSLRSQRRPAIRGRSRRRQSVRLPETVDCREEGIVGLISHPRRALGDSDSDSGELVTGDLRIDGQHISAIGEALSRNGAELIDAAGRPRL